MKLQEAVLTNPKIGHLDAQPIHERLFRDDKLNVTDGYPARACIHHVLTTRGARVST
jgi:hypothetical protein